MEIYSEQGVWLKGYTNSGINSGNCGWKTYGISLNKAAFTGFFTVIKFQYNEAAFNTGFAIQAFTSLISQTSLNNVYYQELQASYLFYSNIASNSGSYDQTIQFNGNNSNQAGNVGYSFTSGTGNTGCNITFRALNEASSMAINFNVFCTHWNRITVTYPST